MRTAIHIGNVTIDPPCALAPMEGITDRSFRRMIRGLGGCGLTVTEFVSSEAMTRDVRRAWQMAEINADEHPVSIQIYGRDPERMAQAIGNLISNAIKYTPEGGLVKVTAGSSKNQAWIAVRDNGPGITAEECERIFEPFYRSRQDRRFPQGLGLGLTIARDLVEAHGGHLELISEPGEGSRFTIYLPN